jgi:hypothetical protein
MILSTVVKSFIPSFAVRYHTIPYIRHY